ncbi:MAG: NAD(P)(+) transhydrogenase (Re/Si-specific) subunit beta, partial [Myxococcota bacterium]
PVLIRGGELFGLDEALPISDPALDLGNPFKGPFKAEAIEWDDIAQAAMELARIAGILPAFLVDPEGAGEAHELEATDLAAYTSAGALKLVTRARLPVARSEEGEIIAFRSTADTREHVALIIGANDVVNPEARTNPKSPIAGMPILDVDFAKTVMVVKRSLSPGFAGIPNPLFAADNSMMLFGDGKKMILDLVGALKEYE